MFLRHAVSRPCPRNTERTGNRIVTIVKSARSIGLGSASIRCVQPLLFNTLTLALCAVALPAATLERLSLDDMIAKSTAIVRGKVLNSYTASSGPMIYTHYRVQVSEALKGPSSRAVDIQMPGGTANNLRQTFSGVPQLNAGDEFVFFLWTGKSGTAQVLGLTQGLFSVAKSSGADPIATRAASTEVMLQPGTATQVKDQTLSMHLSQLRSRIQATLAGSQGTGR